MFGSVKLETVIIFAPTRGTSIPHQKNDNRALSRSYTTSSPHQCVFVIVGLKKEGLFTEMTGLVNFGTTKGNC